MGIGDCRLDQIPKKVVDKLIEKLWNEKFMEFNVGKNFPYGKKTST
jgi:hypothetical protein